MELIAKEFRLSMIKLVVSQLQSYQNKSITTAGVSLISVYSVKLSEITGSLSVEVLGIFVVC